MISRLCVVAAVAIVAGCASTPKLGNVIPEEGGIYQVVTTGESNDTALSSALHSAKTTCEQRQSRFVVLDQKTEYKGLVSESTNNVMKALPLIPNFSSETDYRLEMRFKCET